MWRLEWRTALPYRLVFESRATRVDPPHVLEAAASGELRGTGRWSLSGAGAEGRETLVRYDWDVGTTKAWMNALAPIARPLFAWNHDVLMTEGGRALARHLGVELLGEAPTPRSLVAHLRGAAHTLRDLANRARAPELDDRDGHVDRRERLDDEPKDDGSGGNQGLTPPKVDINGCTVAAPFMRTSTRAPGTTCCAA